MEITYKIWISFKALASKKAATWSLRKPQSNDKTFKKNHVFQLSRGIKNIHRSKLYQ